MFIPRTGAIASAGGATVPSAPTIGTVTRISDTSVSIPFTPPASDGGSTITSYTVTSSPSVSLTVTGGTTSPLTATGTFAGGQAYTFTVRAVNIKGSGTASSASNSVTPKAATAPGQPTIMDYAINSATSVAFDYTVLNGGSPITGVSVTSSPSIPLTVTSFTSSNVTFSGSFVSNTAYTFTIVVSNAVGSSPSSPVSASLKPNSIPATPTGVTAAVDTTTSVNLNWTLSKAQGSTPTSIQVTSSPSITLTVNYSTSEYANVSGSFASGTNYTFRVRAVNATGTGSYSAYSNSVNPSGVAPTPTAPTLISVSMDAGSGINYITWSNGSNYNPSTDIESIALQNSSSTVGSTKTSNTTGQTNVPGFYIGTSVRLIMSVNPNGVQTILYTNYVTVT